MVYYVAYRASKDFKNRGLIVRRLRSLGCKPICRSFWMVSQENIGAVAKLLQKNFPVILKKTREFVKPNLVKEKKVMDLGSLIVVAHKTPKEAKRGKIKGLLRRTPYIRLCRGVYILTHWHRRFDKLQKTVNAWDFYKAVKEVYEDAVIIPRIVVVNQDSTERLLREAERRVKKEVLSITLGYKSLYKRLGSGGINSQAATGAAKALRRRLVNVRKVAAFYKRWLKLDLSSVIIRPYPAMKKIRVLLQEEYELPLARAENDFVTERT